MRRWNVLTGLVILGFVLAGCRTEVSPLGQPPAPTATALPTQPRPTARPTATRPPLATATPTAVAAQSRPGFYVISNPDGANLTAPQFPVAGDLFYLPWELAEPEPGQHNWALLDRYLQSRDAVGKRAAIAIVTYGGQYDGGLRMPEWARVDGPPGSAAATIVTGPQRAFPRYWSAAYLEQYGDFVRALAARYRHDPRMEFVGIGVGMYGETKPLDDEDEAAAQEYGLTSEVWVQTVNAIVDLYTDAFAGGVVRPFLQYGPFFEHPRERWLWASHAAERGIGLANLALYPDMNRAISAWGQLEPLRVYSDTVAVMFEGYLTTLPDPIEFEWGLLQALDKRTDYIRLRRQFFADFDDAGRVTRERTEFTGIMRRWQPYLGATAATTPSIWVALRAHRDPTCYGTFGCETPPDGYEPGNYTFFLDQVDGPGATLLPVSNDARVTWLDGNPTAPYDATLPPGAECWVCKRTDEQSGNTQAHFEVADAVRGRFTQGATVRVRYLDRGADTWRILYGDGNGLREGPVVQKGNTNAWRWAEFTLADFRPLPSGSVPPDLILSSEGDGDEWLHLVEMVPLAATARTSVTAPLPPQNPAGSAQGQTAGLPPQPAALQFDLGLLGRWSVRLETLPDRLRVDVVPVE